MTISINKSGLMKWIYCSVLSNCFLIGALQWIENARIIRFWGHIQLIYISNYNKCDTRFSSIHTELYALN